MFVLKPPLIHQYATLKQSIGSFTKQIHSRYMKVFKNSYR